MKPVDMLRKLGRPVAYYPNLVKRFGSVTATVLFCQLFYWHDKAHSELGVYKTTEEITEETGLSYKEQLSARKQLKAVGVLIETHKRLEHKIYYKIDIDKLNDLLSGDFENSPSSQREFGEQPNGQLGDNPNGISLYTENTTENTTDIKKINKKTSSVTVDEMVDSLDGLSRDVASDYLLHRKVKKTALTPRAWAGVCREVKLFTKQTGRPPDDALIEAIERDWKAVKCEWLLNSLRPQRLKENQIDNNSREWADRVVL